MRFPRCSGVLLHPTSLPGPYGIGDLGGEAFAFVDFLAEAGQSLWQVLPLGPTGYGDSPYQCFSAFAGNPLLVNLDALRAQGLLSDADFEHAPAFAADAVGYGTLIPWKHGLLRLAARRFHERAGEPERAEYRAWCAHHAAWLEDFALFMALNEANGCAWTDWPEPLRRREPAALTAARGAHAAAIEAQRFVQWTFFRQWAQLHAYAHGRGVAIMGDAPIFAALDSADVWSHPELFHLGPDGRPTVVAGVPPDEFSPVLGQLWGNPLYDWDAHAETGYAWWIARVRAQMELVDRLRLDHFIGFTRYYAVPAADTDARNGEYRPGPGAALFVALAGALGDLPIVAEDLGVLTPEVETLRDAFEFPGMKILQFAFGGESNSAFLPHTYGANCVAYTGTHDNDTTVGWWSSAQEHERGFLARYLGRQVHEAAWDLARLGMASVADTFLVPAQDLLSIGGEARMNLPGRAGGNWEWRLRAGQLDDALAARLRDLTALYGRLPPD